MSNLEKYNTVFADTFAVVIESLNNDFTSESVDKWDSILQLTLVTAMEDAFDVMLEPEDIMDFKSYDFGKVILAKYGVEI